MMKKKKVCFKIFSHLLSCPIEEEEEIEEPPVPERVDEEDDDGDNDDIFFGLLVPETVAGGVLRVAVDDKRFESTEEGPRFVVRV